MMEFLVLAFSKNCNCVQLAKDLCDLAYFRYRIGAELTVSAFYFVLFK